MYPRALYGQECSLLRVEPLGHGAAPKVGVYEGLLEHMLGGRVANGPQCHEWLQICCRGQLHSRSRSAGDYILRDS